MIWRRSILLLVYGVGARSDVTVGVWMAVEKYIAWEQTRRRGGIRDRSYAYGEEGLVRINDWTWWEERIRRNTG